MLNHELDTEQGILVLSPEAPLSSQDFATITEEIDPYIAKHGKLRGVLIRAHAFPGWSNLDAAISHMRFIESHHQNIERLAVVSDNRWLTELPKFASHLVHPKVEHFSEAKYDAAIQWLVDDRNKVIGE